MPHQSNPESVPPVDELLTLAVTALGGRRREGQVQMAQVVADAIDSGTHVFVQAGTGTGKSLGYLVPAVRHAVVDGGRIVVATATLALQRQLTTRDLPDLVAALTPALPAPPRFALLKGRSNYVCRYKLGGGFPVDEQDGLFDLADSPAVAEHPRRPPTGTFAADVLRAREWADETPTGDRDDLVPGVSERAWRQISVVAAECLGSNCPMFGDCFVERAKGAAGEADVIVTNHAMLALDAAGHSLIPDHDLLIIDEGHELTDRVTHAVSGSLTEAAIEAGGRIMRRGLGMHTDDLDAAAKALAAALADLPAGRLIGDLPPALAGALSQVSAAARALVSTVKQESAGPADGTRQQALAAGQDILTLADRFVAAGDGDVIWVEHPEDQSANRAALHIAPLSVAELLRTTVLANATTVLTSATLALGRSFETAARAVGLGASERTDAADGMPHNGTRWMGVDVGSPFDYPRQGILYVAARLPRPGRDGLSDEQLDELTALVRAAGGRTLGLFSSRRGAQLAARVLRERVDMPILVQGEDGLPTLVRQFADDPHTCLFGTLSLWQGVDVPGPSCQLVTIDRLPFPRPDDPVRSARAAAADAAGHNGFMTVAAAHAALLLAQGAGRLIRTAEDRGVVAVLDSRLSTARYGGFLRRSLPPLWPTTDLAVATAALERLAAQADLPQATRRNPTSQGPKH